MATDKKKHKDISRMDQPSKKTLGWYVRVRFKGNISHKLFSDRKQGGRQKALIAAIIWRDKERKRLGKPISDKHIFTVSSTSTGVVGVNFSKKTNYYYASWVTKKGKPKKSSFAVNKYGKDKAFKLACALRKKMEAIRLKG